MKAHVRETDINHEEEGNCISLEFSGKGLYLSQSIVSQALEMAGPLITF
jgi:hypothetical protein